MKHSSEERVDRNMARIQRAVERAIRKLPDVVYSGQPHFKVFIRVRLTRILEHAERLGWLVATGDDRYEREDYSEPRAAPFVETHAADVPGVPVDLAAQRVPLPGVPGLPDARQGTAHQADEES